MLNGDNFGPVTLFRVYPDGVDTFSMPEQERTDPALPRHASCATTTTTGGSSSWSRPTRCRGDGVVISMTDCYRETDYGEPIVALKSYILSPFSEDQHVNAVLESIGKARRQLA